MKNNFVASNNPQLYTAPGMRKQNMYPENSALMYQNYYMASLNQCIDSLQFSNTYCWCDTVHGLNITSGSVNSKLCHSNEEAKQVQNIQEGFQDHITTRKISTPYCGFTKNNPNFNSRIETQVVPVRDVSHQVVQEASEVVNEGGHQLGPSSNSESASSSEAISSGQKFSKRRDVVKKTIFRSFKKYYVDTFKSQYNFIKRVRRRNYDPSAVVFKEAQKYITRFYSTLDTHKLALFLVAIIDTKQKFKHPDPVFSEVRSAMLSMMKHFNCEKLMNLLKHKEFKLLTGEFLQQPFEEISRHKEDADVKSIYVEQIRCLQEQISL